ncbi:MAG TPA: hypothetical protein VGL26_03255 [Jatrophihabitans sp.]|jgi:hypothetical protein
MLSALQSDQIGKIGVGVIVALVVIGLLISMIITKIVGRIIVLVIVVALAAWVWQQRTEIQHKVNDCNLNMTFFGVTVKMPKEIQDACKAKGKLPTSLKTG